MRVTVDIDDTLLEQAAKIAGGREKTTVVRMGLYALVRREKARRLLALTHVRRLSGVLAVPRRREGLICDLAGGRRLDFEFVCMNHAY